MSSCAAKRPSWWRHREGWSPRFRPFGFARQRAEDKVAQMQARSGAVDELMASGALENLGGSGDPIQAELDRMSGDSGVDNELERLKGELESGDGKALGSSGKEQS